MVTIKPPLYDEPPPYESDSESTTSSSGTESTTEFSSGSESITQSELARNPVDGDGKNKGKKTSETSEESFTESAPPSYTENDTNPRNSLKSPFQDKPPTYGETYDFAKEQESRETNESPIFKVQDPLCQPKNDHNATKQPQTKHKAKDTRTSDKAKEVEIQVERDTNEVELDQERLRREMKYARLFNVICIVCALLSLILTPVIEIIPLICICWIWDMLPLEKRGITLTNMIVNVCVFIYYLVLIIVLAFFTYGIALLLLIFLVPYIYIIWVCMGVDPDEVNTCRLLFCAFFIPCIFCVGAV